MIGRLQSEYGRFQVRQSKLTALGGMKPLTAEQVDRAYRELNRFMDRAAAIRKLQKHFLEVASIVDAIDFHVKQSTKKGPGQENITPEHLAILKLAQHSGASKVRRVDTGETIRVNHLDDYKGLSDRHTLFFFSASPRPGVYSFPLDAREISTAPVYEPITLEETKNDEK